MYFEKNESLKLDFTKKSKKEKQPLSAFQEEDLNRLIEMAWQDRSHARRKSRHRSQRSCRGNQ